MELVDGIRLDCTNARSSTTDPSARSRKVAPVEDERPAASFERRGCCHVDAKQGRPERANGSTIPGPSLLGPTKRARGPLGRLGGHHPAATTAMCVGFRWVGRDAGREKAAISVAHQADATGASCARATGSHFSNTSEVAKSESSRNRPAVGHDAPSSAKTGFKNTSGASE